MFDDLARDVSSALSGVFGDVMSYTHDGGNPFDVPAVLRLDVETLDEQDQVVTRMHTLRIARADISVVPKRGDKVSYNGATYTVGVRVADDGYSYVYEVTR